MTQRCGGTGQIQAMPLGKSDIKMQLVPCPGCDECRVIDSTNTIVAVNVEQKLAQHFAPNPKLGKCEIVAVGYMKDRDPDTGDFCQDTLQGAVMMRSSRFAEPAGYIDTFHVLSFHINTEETSAYWGEYDLPDRKAALVVFNRKMADIRGVS